MTVKDRLISVIDMLGLTKSEFERRANLSNGYVYSVRRSLGSDAINRIKVAFSEINLDYITKGEGFPLMRGENKDDEVDVVCEDGVLLGVPHISFEGNVGAFYTFDSVLKSRVWPRFAMPNMVDCDFTVCFKGRSMLDRVHPERSIQDGDYLGCRKLSSLLIRWGEIYTLATLEGFITVVVQVSTERGCVKCVPFNTDEGFAPYDLSLGKIFDWAIVKTVGRFRELN